MKAALIAVALLAAALPFPASADELARDGNLALVAQLADAVTTRYNLRDTGVPCVRTERDPLARPFARSDVGDLAMTVVVNFALRKAFARRPKWLRLVAVAEAGVAANNLAHHNC
jgi:hypothetical protein